MAKVKPVRYAVSFEMEAGPGDEKPYPIQYVKDDLKEIFLNVSKIKVVKVPA